MNKLLISSLMVMVALHATSLPVYAEMEINQFDGRVLFLTTSWFERSSDRRSRFMYPILVSKDNGLTNFLEIESESEKLFKLLTMSKRKEYRIEQDNSACSDIPLFIERPNDAAGFFDTSTVLKVKTRRGLRQIPHASSPIQMPSGQLVGCPSGKKIGSHDYDGDGFLECIVLEEAAQESKPKKLVVKNSRTPSEYLNITLSNEESVLGVKDIDNDGIPEILIITENDRYPINKAS